LVKNGCFGLPGLKKESEILIQEAGEVKKFLNLLSECIKIINLLISFLKKHYKTLLILT